MMRDWSGDMGWAGGAMWFGPVMWLGLLAIVVMAAIAVSRRSSARDNGPMTSGTPRDILDARFARGEIEHEDYEARRKAML